MIQLTIRLALLLSLLSLATACNSTPKRAFGTLEPGSPQLEQLYQEGRVDYQNGEYDDAAQKFAHVVEVDPTHLNALINWGVTLSRSGQPVKAIPKYQQVLARDPNNAEAYYNWGVALQRLRRHSDAIERYQRAVDLKRDLLTPELQSYFNRHHRAASDREIGATPVPPPSQ